MGKFIKIILKSNLMQFKKNGVSFIEIYQKHIKRSKKVRGNKKNLNVTSKKLWSLPSNSAFLPAIMHKGQKISEANFLVLI